MLVTNLTQIYVQILNLSSEKQKSSLRLQKHKKLPQKPGTLGSTYFLAFAYVTGLNTITRKKKMSTYRFISHNYLCKYSQAVCKMGMGLSLLSDWNYSYHLFEFFIII